MIMALALSAILCLLSGFAFAGPFLESDFEAAPGILPDGQFAFAVRVVESGNTELAERGIPPGTLITHLHRISPDKVVLSDGPDGMIENLSSLMPGDKLIITCYLPGNAEKSEITVYLPSAAERFAAQRAALIQTQTAAARASMNAGDPFGNAYWGVRLRLFSLGYFETLRDLLDQEGAAWGTAMDRLGGDTLPWFGDLVELSMRLESATSPYGGVLSAYAVTRLSVLGDCGEPVDRLTATRTEWTEYRNGLGTYQGSSSKTVTSEDLEVPAGFGDILRRNGSGSVSFVARWDLVPIVRALGCDSDTRRRMEANMLAFYHARSPVWRAPTDVDAP